MKKLLALLSVGMAVAVLAGCGLSPVGAPTVTIDPIPSITVPGGGSNYVDVTGKVEADTEISAISYSILNSNDQPVSMLVISVTGPNPNAGDEKIDFGDRPIRITVFNGATAGTYKLKISVTAGPSMDATFNFTVIGGTGDVNTAIVTIGSYANSSIGSSIDLNSGKVKSAALATQSGSGVDLVCTYSTSFSAFRIFNPVYARDSSNITAFSGWVNPAATSFFKLTGVNFDDYTTKAQIQAAYTGGTPLTSASCAVNDIFVVRTNQTNYVLIKILSFEQSTSGTAQIKWAK
jgi:hypothetical protein